MPDSSPNECPTRQSPDGPSLALSVIIPAYNESRRLPAYLEAIRQYTSRHYGDNCEVIVVDDGSSDRLADVLGEHARSWPQLRSLRHLRNLGKGAAVRTGVMAARGMRLLYADADGATAIDQEQRLREAIEAGADLAVGSRLIRAEGVVRDRKWSRALVGRAFATAAGLLLPTAVQDTQCGFKMLRSRPARHLFAVSQERGYLFDLEILALAQKCGYRVTEIPISWSERAGSRLAMHRDGAKLLAGLCRLRRRLAKLPMDYHGESHDNRPRGGRSEGAQ